MENKSTYPIYARASAAGSGCRGEVSKDFILPDSYPDIRRILYAKARLMPSGSDTGNGKMTFDGRIFCDVIFSDDNNALHSVGFSNDYKISCLIPKGEGDTELVALPEIESISAKAVNPRKVGVRAVINMREGVWRLTDPMPEVPEEWNGVDRLSLEMQVSEIKYAVCRLYTDGGREISEDIELDRSLSPIDQIIGASVSVSLPDASVKDGRIEVRGSATVDIIYCDTDGNVISRQVELPFSQGIEADGADPGALCIAKVYIDKVSALPAENAFGELKVIELDFNCLIYVLCTSEYTGQIASDAYSTLYDTENVAGTLRYSRAGAPLSSEETRSVVEELEPGTVPVCVFGDARVQPSEDGGSDLRVCLTVITRNAGGVYSSIRLEDIFGVAVGDCSSSICEAAVRSASAFAERDKLRVNYTYTLNSVARPDAEVERVSGIVLTGAGEKTPDHSLAVYYPEKGESIWNAAKKYRVSRGALMAANGLSSESESRPFLLIPKRKKPDFSEII